jgi:hypothetical protein
VGAGRLCCDGAGDPRNGFLLCAQRGRCGLVDPFCWCRHLCGDHTRSSGPGLRRSSRRVLRQTSHSWSRELPRRLPSRKALRARGGGGQVSAPCRPAYGVWCGEGSSRTSGGDPPVRSLTRSTPPRSAPPVLPAVSAAPCQQPAVAQRLPSHAPCVIGYSWLVGLLAGVVWRSGGLAGLIGDGEGSWERC